MRLKIEIENHTYLIPAGNVETFITKLNLLLREAEAVRSYYGKEEPLKPIVLQFRAVIEG